MTIEPWPRVLAEKQAEIKQQGLWRRRRHIGSMQRANVDVDNQSLLNFSSNDYLGFASRPELIKASQNASVEWGVGAGASHLVCGHQTPHHKLELALAEFVGSERVLLFSNGYMANLALNTAFLDKSDLLLHDKLNHASLVDGARLSNAQFKRYAHLDVSHAQRRIDNTEYDRLMLVTDGVFSMDGDVAPLNELLGLASARKGVLCVDDAHGFGVLGKGGQGTLSQLGVPVRDNVLMMGTLGKAFGCFGSFVAGDSIFIEHLIQTARSYIYTTALPANVVSACLAALRLLQDQHDDLHQHLGGLIDYFKQACAAENVPLMASDTPIQPVLIGDESASVDISDRLLSEGFLVPAIRTPTVAKGHARLRVTLTATHTQQQVDVLVKSLSNALKTGVA